MVSYEGPNHVNLISPNVGFFKVLNQEFILTNIPVSITIMIVPYVLTETVSLHVDGGVGVLSSCVLSAL
jgi:hypothetical protein